MLNFLLGVALCIYIWNASAEWRTARRYRSKMRALERMWAAKAHAERVAMNNKFGLLTNFKPPQKWWSWRRWGWTVAMAFIVILVFG